MEFVICDSTQKASFFAALVLHDAIKKKTVRTIGLATGKTYKPIYTAFRALSNKDNGALQNISWFQLDEYLALPQNSKKSFYNELDQSLFKPLNVSSTKIHAIPTQGSLDRYEKEIKVAGGIDMQLLGIGRDGHVGFNEPGTPFTSKIHKVRLAKQTRLDARSRFKSIQAVPTEAVTLGIKSILSSKKIILAAFGSSKAKAVALAFASNPSEKIPASALQNHKNVVVILDKKAAALLPSSLISKSKISTKKDKTI